MKENFIDKYIQIYQEFLKQYDLYNYDFSRSKLEKERINLNLSEKATHDEIIEEASKTKVGFHKIKNYRCLTL